MTSPASPAATARAARAWIEARAGDLIDDVAALVALDSPSDDAALLQSAATALADRFALPGATVSAHDGGAGPHLAIDLGRPDVLVLGHYDTVWPAGTAGRRPFAVADDVASGPGVLDMKAAIAMARWALATRQAVDPDRAPNVRISLTPDEEIGNHATRTRLAAWAAQARAVLVLEPPLPGGALKTARKGIATARLAVAGRAAHAGLEPHLGINAAVHAARAALYADALAEHRRGLTVNVGSILAAGPANVVPAAAELEVDVRGWSEADLAGTLAALEAWAASQDGVVISVDGVVHRPPWQRSAASDGALAAARQVGAALGLDLGEGEAGGGSEANLVAASGTPILDGLGPEGAGAHAEHEHISIRSLLDRTALLAGLTLALEQPSG